MKLTKEVESWLNKLKLGSGTHSGPDSSGCVMEAVAFVAGEKWSDHPKCASVVIGDFLRVWNDSLGDADRQMLKPYVLKLVGTAAPKEVEVARARLAQDWLIRVFTPTWLELAGLSDHTEALRSLNEIVSTADLEAAQPKLDAARKGAAAAWDAAWAAAWAAAGEKSAKALEPTVKRLQRSALDLLDRMISLQPRLKPVTKKKRAARA